MAEKYDFGGWATRNNILCTDGRVILDDAFAHQDGARVSLVWNHQHNDAFNVLGFCDLENRPGEGVYAYGKFNDTESGRTARELVHSGSVDTLSIFANQLRQTKSKEVVHGTIREVSLVLAGANSGAKIVEQDIYHSDDPAIDCYDAKLEFSEKIEELHDVEIIEHSDTNKEEESEVAKEETIQDVLDSMTDKQYKVAMYLVDQAANGQLNGDEEPEEEEEVQHNAFATDYEMGNEELTLSHAAIEEIFADARRMGSLRDSVLAHSEEYGIDNIEYLFPDAQVVNNTPDFIQREMDWVKIVMAGVHKNPFSRIKSIHADITEEAARARGYIKGKFKKEEVFSLLKRTTTPQTIYKKQKLDRDDIIDITSFDVVAWLKSEMRMMLDEEIARAILVGDGRLVSDDDKIQEDHIRPIWKDNELYTIRYVLPDVNTKSTPEAIAEALIKGAVRARKQYKGSGSPRMFTTEEWITEGLLLEDAMKRRLYDDQGKLATSMRVSSLTPVPVMENLTREVGGKKYMLLGLIVNLTDYTVGADKGGSIEMFADFDIDFNQNKYLIETRCSGALMKPFSAIAIEIEVAA